MLIAPKRLKLRTSNLTLVFPGTVRTWHSQIFPKRGDIKILLGGDMHSHERLLVIILCFFFPNKVYRTNTKPVQVWTPIGPKNTDPLSVILTQFSRSQTHFFVKNPKLQIHITSSFMIRFWSNFVGMDYYTTLCWWPTFRWPWPTSSGQTWNRPEIFCHWFGQI